MVLPNCLIGAQPMRCHIKGGTQMRGRYSVLAALLATWQIGCGDSKSSSTTADTAKTTSPGEDKDAGDVAVSGTLALGLRLAGKSVSHVVALDTDSGKAKAAEVDEDGKFSLGIDNDKPWVLTFIDDSKTGSDMKVSQ